MTRKRLYLMTAMLVLGITATSVANAEDVPNSVEVTSFPFELSVMENHSGKSSCRSVGVDNNNMFHSTELYWV